MPSSDSTSEKSSAGDLRRSGEAIAVLIMLLALFAFGLQRREGGASQDLINWVEIPAILIVFVLAELGVSLVAVAKGVQDDTQEASDTARATLRQVSEAANRLENAEQQLEKVNKAASERIQELHSWMTAHEYINEELRKPDPLPGATLPNAVGLEPRVYWPRLFIFGRSWVPESVSEQAKGMLGALFQEFVGENEGNGTVRRGQEHVECIALDSIYATLSEKWLQCLSNSIEGKRVV